MITRIRLPHSPFALEVEQGVPLCLLPDYQFKPWPLLFSTFLHLCVGATVWVTTEFPIAWFFNPPKPPMPQARVISLLARRDFVQRESEAPLRAPVSRPKQREEPVQANTGTYSKPSELPPVAPPAASSGDAGQTNTREAAAAPRPFRDLPIIHRKTPQIAKDLLLQPDAPDLPLQSATPDVLLMTELMRKQKTFIRPPDAPRQRKLPAAMQVDTDVPKLGSDPSAILAVARAAWAKPTFPAAAKFPVSVPQADAPPELVTTAGGAGTDRPNIVSIPMQSVPQFDQLAAASTQASPAPSKVAANGPPGSRDRAGLGRQAATASTVGARLGDDNNGGVGSEGGLSPSSGGPGGRPVSAPLPGAGSSNLGVRIDRPRNGSYDVAITNAESGIPGAVGLMKGRPVYTVYVPMGTIRDWVLQYAAIEHAGAGSRPRNGTVVSLDQPAPLSAPFAFTVQRPELKFKGDGRYAFVHGFINAGGKFESLQVVGTTGFENPENVLGNLIQWEFRPAMKDGVPIAVEVLLCVPNTPG